MSVTQRTHNKRELKSVRRSLRRNLTDHERLLWNKLRNRQLNGYKFFRQYSVGKYVLDFYCPVKRVGVELDGGHHGEEIQARYDMMRDRYLATISIRVIRFWNHEVKSNLPGVLETLLHTLETS